MYCHIHYQYSHHFHNQLHHEKQVAQVVDHERDSAYFGTTSGDVIKVVSKCNRDDNH